MGLFLEGMGRMAKAKNHTNNNQNSKAHRNGIKRPLRQKAIAVKGMCPKFLRNQRFAKKNNAKAVEDSLRDHCHSSRGGATRQVEGMGYWPLPMQPSSFICRPIF